MIDVIGWITPKIGVSVRVHVFGFVGKCYKVKFLTKKLGLKNRVGAVPFGSISFVPPHLTAKK